MYKIPKHGVKGMVGSGSKICATFVCGMVVVLLLTTSWYIRSHNIYATTVITINQNENEVVRADHAFNERC